MASPCGGRREIALSWDGYARISTFSSRKENQKVPKEYTRYIMGALYPRAECCQFPVEL